MSRGRWCGAALLCCALAACRFDTRGLAPARDGAPLEVVSTWEASADLLAGDASAREAKPPPDTAPLESSACAGAPCPLGCKDATRCNWLLPSNSLGITEAIFTGASKDWTVASSSSVTINTDTGEIRDGSSTTIRPGGGAGTVASGVYWNTKTQTGTRELSIFVLASLTVPAGKTLSITGSRAFALYATGSVSIQGTLSAPASGRSAGPGGYHGGDKEADGESCFGGEGKQGSHASSFESGGGGGGRNQTGGKGGDAGSSAGGAGGDALDPSLVPLFGGCGGGGGGVASEGGEGGGGGGAIQISVNGALTVTVTGVITVPGGGGQAENGSGDGGGGGGGSGGAILLEAVTIAVSGLLAANGGGGSGSDCGSGEGGDGANGTSSTKGSSGGSCVGSGCTPGGEGGAKSPEGGAAKDGSGCGGGGGGAAGRIQLSSQSAATIGAANASPAPAPSVGTIPGW